MKTWLCVWEVLLIVGISAYAILCVAVAIGGIFDIKKMFRALGEEKSETRDQAQS